MVLLALSAVLSAFGVEVLAFSLLEAERGETLAFLSQLGPSVYSRAPSVLPFLGWAGKEPSW